MRLETGVVQEGDDWPGVFIRGDDALRMARAMRAAIKLLPEKAPSTADISNLQLSLARASLGRLLTLLEACDAQNCNVTQKVRLERDEV